MIRTTPFYPRTRDVDETGLWNHWAGYLVSTKYLIDERLEYFALRNACGVFDTSPLFKYRIAGPDAEKFLSTVLARDVRSCRPGAAQYTMWCDDHGWIIEDGVVMRLAPDEFWLTSAEPNLAYFEGMIGRGRVEIEDLTAAHGILAVQGPASRSVLAAVAPEVADLRSFGVTQAKIRDAAVVVSRTGYTGDLGYEIWTDADDAPGVWDAVIAAGDGRGILPFGSLVMHMARIEAGLLLIDVDYRTSRFAWTDSSRATPLELGYEWMFRKLDRDDRSFVGRAAIEEQLARDSTRFRLVGLDVDPAAYERTHHDLGLPPSKDHIPVEGPMRVYDDSGAVAGDASSFMYSPLMQRHIAIARIRPRLAAPGTHLSIEVTIEHRNHRVPVVTRRLPFFDPPRRKA